MAGHDHRSDESPLRISQQFAEVGPCGQCGEIRRTLRFEQRKFIKPLPNIAPRPATQQCPPFTANVQIMEPPFTHLRPSLLHGTQGDRPGREGEATSGQRTLPAAGLRRSTQQRPEIHQSLIIGSRPLRIQQRLRQLHTNPTPRPGIDGHLYVEKPGQHPEDIAVQDGVRQTERHRSHRSSGIIAHARQRTEGVRLRRELSAEPADDLPGGGVQIPGTAVIPQSLPQLEYFVFRSGRQRTDIGKTLRKAQVVTEPLSYTRLLEDDLREPDTIGVAGTAPGQVAPAAGVPIEQYGGDSIHNSPQK